MKRYCLMIIAALGIGTYASAQIPGLYNNGAALYISKDTYVQINGDFVNNDGSNLKNAGIIATSGNVTNKVTMNQADAGELLLEGSSQAIISGSPIFATQVTISNPSGITLNTPLRLSGVMSFAAGILTIPDSNNTVVFESSASVNLLAPPSNSSHIHGFVSREGTGSFTYPVGNGIAYQPVGVNLTANSSGLVANYVSGDAGDGSFTTVGSSPVPLVARNTQEYWSLTPVGSASGSVTMYWDEYNNTGIANTADLAVAHLSQTGWQNEGATASSGTISEGYVVSNTISTWSPFTLGSTANSSPLPVRLVSFTANNAEGVVALDWKIADARAFSHFEVERAWDAATFEKIGEILYNEESTYHFVDSQKITSSWSDQLYYRLKMVDSDGSFAYSKIEHVKFEVDFNVIVYPNPVAETIYLQATDFSKVKRVQLVNSQGKMVYNSENSSQSINAKALKPGFYFIKITNNKGAVMTQKVAIN